MEIEQDKEVLSDEDAFEQMMNEMEGIVPEEKEPEVEEKEPEINEEEPEVEEGNSHEEDDSNTDEDVEVPDNEGDENHNPESLLAELQETRNRLKAAIGQNRPVQQQNAELQRRIAALEANRTQSQPAPPPRQTKKLEAWDSYQKNFPEEAKAIAEVMRANGVDPAEVSALKQEISQLKESHQQAEEAGFENYASSQIDLLETHYGHSDFRQLIGSDDFYGWLATQPPGIQHIWDNSYDASDYDFVLQRYKGESPPHQETGQENPLQERTPSKAQKVAAQRQQRKKDTSPVTGNPSAKVRDQTPSVMLDDEDAFARLIDTDDRYADLR